MIILGLFFGFMGPFSEFWFLKDYWQPQYAFGRPFVIEDFLFGFLSGSGPPVVYQVFFRKKLGPKKYKCQNTRFFLTVGLGFTVLIFLNNVLKINSILASTAAFLVTSLVILFLRRDLTPASLATGALTGLFAFFFYSLILPCVSDYLASTWLLYNQPLGRMFLGVPLTELLWATGAGLAAGSFYEFWQGYTIVPLESP